MGFGCGSRCASCGALLARSRADGGDAAREPATSKVSDGAGDEGLWRSDWGKSTGSGATSLAPAVAENVLAEAEGITAESGAERAVCFVAQEEQQRRDREQADPPPVLTTCRVDVCEH